MVLSSAVPMEPPTCWLVLIIAEATPASSCWTAEVAPWKAVDIAPPSPRPMRISAGSTWVT